MDARSSEDGGGVLAPDVAAKCLLRLRPFSPEATDVLSAVMNPLLEGLVSVGQCVCLGGGECESVGVGLIRFDVPM